MTCFGAWKEKKSLNVVIIKECKPWPYANALATKEDSHIIGTHVIGMNQDNTTQINARSSEDKNVQTYKKKK